MDLSKCQESNPGNGVYIPPFPLLAVMGKTRTSRTVRDALAGCPHFNSNGKNAKSTAVRSGRWAGRTVHQDPADYLRGPRGPSVSRPRTVRPVHRAALCFVKNDGPLSWGRWTVRLEAHFLENFCQKSQILHKYKKLADRLLQGLGLSAQHLKTKFS
jgi:hypothetical protein